MKVINTQHLPHPDFLLHFTIISILEVTDVYHIHGMERLHSGVLAWASQELMFSTACCLLEIDRGGSIHTRAVSKHYKKGHFFVFFLFRWVSAIIINAAAAPRPTDVVSEATLGALASIMGNAVKKTLLSLPYCFKAPSEAWDKIEFLKNPIKYLMLNPPLNLKHTLLSMCLEPWPLFSTFWRSRYQDVINRLWSMNADHLPRNHPYKRTR